MAESETQATTTTAHPGFGVPPAASGASLVQITADEYQRFRGVEKQFGDLQAKHLSDLALKETERLQALAESGQSKKALDEQRQTWESKLADAQAGFEKMRGQYHGKAKVEVIAGSLVGREFAGDKPETKSKVAQKFMREIDPLFETIEDAQGNLIVREKGSGRPAADAMRELINAPENQHYFAPESRGGAGTDGTRSASHGQSSSENPHKPGTVEYHGWNYRKSMLDQTGLVVSHRP